MDLIEPKVMVKTEEKEPLENVISDGSTTNYINTTIKNETNTYP